MKDLIMAIENYLDIGDCYDVIERGNTYLVVEDLETNEQMRIDFSSLI